LGESIRFNLPSQESRYELFQEKSSLSEKYREKSILNFELEDKVRQKKPKLLIPEK
jgi:hypothetical protein